MTTKIDSAEMMKFFFKQFVRDSELLYRYDNKFIWKRDRPKTYKLHICNGYTNMKIHLQSSVGANLD